MELACARCRSHFTAPALTEDVRRQLGEVRRGRGLAGSMAAMKLLHTLRVDAAPAKFIALHLTRAAGTCHHCGAQLDGAEACPRCRALHLDW